jgi:hypothetical protein
MAKAGACHHITVLAFTVIATIISGCATVGDQRVNILYQSTAIAKGGSGDLYLVEEPTPDSSYSTPIQYILGGIKNKDGEQLGNIVTDKAPADLLIDAFYQEFKGAGYNVVQGNSMPREVAKGLKLQSITIKLDEVKGVIVNSKCIVKISVEPWRNGKAINKLEYVAEYTDSVMTGREELLSKTMLQAIQSIMKKAVPEITKILEQ